MCRFSRAQNGPLFTFIGGDDEFNNLNGTLFILGLLLCLVFNHYG